jgi:hypothetical protein
MARAPHGVAEPLAGHVDRHLQTEAGLGMKKGGDVIVLREIGNQLLVARAHLRGLLREGYAGGIHNSEIIAEGLEQLHESEAIEAEHFTGRRGVTAARHFPVLKRMVARAFNPAAFLSRYQ